MPQSRYVRCRYCGSLLRGWLPVANAPDGALLLHHLADMPPDHVGQYLTRMPTDDAHARVVMEAFERVEDQQANRATTSWLLAIFDTAGEVVFSEASQSANQLVERAPGVGSSLVQMSPSVSKVRKTQDVVTRAAQLGCARGLAGSGAHFG